ncbi:MAG: AzlD domain-containing protein [Pseudomonadota bacterium]
MTFDAYDSLVWQLGFILISGWLATDIWRWAGVLLGNRLKDDSEALVLVRCMATGLVAAVIAQLIVFPSGALGRETEAWLRIMAALIGFAAYLAIGKKVGVGVSVSLLVLSMGIYFNV